MIRILHVVTQMNRGGLETMLMNYYRHVDKNKIQFDFLVHRKERGAYDNEIVSMGGSIYRLNQLNPFSYNYRKSLREFFRQHPWYQIIHVHQNCLSSVILRAAKKADIPVRIAHSHSSSQNKNIKYPVKLFYRRLITKYATDLMACGETAGKWMFSGNEFLVLNNAVDIEKYVFNAEKRNRMRADLGVDEGTFLVGHIGRFSYVKNQTFLVDVVKKAEEKIPTKLLLVGDGELRKQIMEKVIKAGLEGKVIFTGIRSDIPDLLQAMDLFVLPSHYEGFPVSVIEAQAAGLPCLISDGVPAECIKTNLVIQLPLSVGVESWAETVAQTVPDKRKNMNQDMLKAGFDIKKNAGWLEEYYYKKYEGIMKSCSPQRSRGNE